MKSGRILLISLLLLAALVLSACGGRGADLPTPTPVDVNAVAQQAIATFSMGLTMTAFAQPTATYTPPPTLTFTPFPTIAIVGTVGTPLGQPLNTCDISVYTNVETIPDGTLMAPGQVFVKKWEVQNTGTCTWTATYREIGRASCRERV